MNPRRGTSLLEVLIGLAIIALLISVVASNWGEENADGTMCRGGYKFVQTRFDTYEYRQLLDEQGHGIPCGNKRG